MRPAKGPLSELKSKISLCPGSFTRERRRSRALGKFLQKGFVLFAGRNSAGMCICKMLFAPVGLMATLFTCL